MVDDVDQTYSDILSEVVSLNQPGTVRRSTGLDDVHLEYTEKVGGGQPGIHHSLHNVDIA